MIFNGISGTAPCPPKYNNPPRIPDEIVWLNIVVGQQRELNELADRLEELKDHVVVSEDDSTKPSP